jgi:D-amino-acid dehydrogenase
VQAGRGYSFSVPIEHVPAGPVYLPAQRVACTPLGDRLRVAGMMEFRAPDAPLDPRRIAAITAATRPLLRGADFDARADEWVGPRPCTPDGLPLIGSTTSPRVYVAGGHGMWGMTLGPVTGQLLAEAISTGHQPAELAPFDPLR